MFTKIVVKPTYLILLVIAISITHDRLAFAEQTTDKPAVTMDALLGTWRLDRFEAVRADQSVFLPFGTSVSGMLVYMPGGQMIVVYGRQDRPIPQQPNAPTPAELAKMLEGFDAYWGTFEV